jgi:hypothetical protein
LQYPNLYSYNSPPIKTKNGVKDYSFTPL